MRRLAAFILALLALCLCACGGAGNIPEAAGETDSPAVTEETARPSGSGSPETFGLLKDIKYYEQYQGDLLLARVEYPVLLLDASEAGTALSSSVDAYNASLAAAAEESYERLMNSAVSDIELNLENPAAYYSHTDLYVTRADSLALSVLSRTETGSASSQSQTFYSSMTFDSRTGRQLALKDVSTDAPALVSHIRAQLEKHYPKAEFYDLEAAMEQYAEDISKLVWTLDYQGISFYFAPYELAPYEEGCFTVGLRFEDHPELFSIYYTRRPYSYAVPMIEGRCLNYDMDDDGVSDLITLQTLSEAGNIGRIEIGVNDSSLTVNVSMTDCEAYVIYAGPSRSYLFINAYNASGYGYISVYRLERTGPSLLGMLYDTSLQAAGFTPECAGIPLLTDPAHLILGTKVELIGTLTGVKDYSIGSAGMPETSDEYYRVYANTTLSTKTDFATAAIDPYTGRGLNTAVKISAGTRMFYHRSDGVAFVDMMSEDGSCCRMYVSGRGEAQTVNGVPVADFFDGVIYK